jgi:glycosyltransferase involved in cell wall biosynthesis
MLNSQRVLVVPDYDVYGGTLTVLLQLLQMHRQQGVITGLLIQPNQARPELLAKFAELGIAPNHIFIKTWGEVGKTLFMVAQWLKRIDQRLHTRLEFAIYTLRGKAQLWLPQLYDWLFIRSVVGQFKPDLITLINGTPNARLGCMLARQPVINIVQTYPTTRLANVTRRFAHWVSRQPRKVFVTVSTFSAKLLTQHLDIQPDAIRIIHNSCREPARKPTPASQQPVGVSVLTVAHMNAYKDPDTWLAVAKHVTAARPHVNFIWLGDGSEYQRICQEITATGLSGRLITPGFVGDVNALDAYYAQSSVYFQPSLIESQGIAVADAMIRGMACVVSNAGGLPESVIDDETGYVCPPRNVLVMCQRLLHLIDQPDLRQKMGNAALIRAQQKFTFAAQAKHYVELYGALLNNR